MKKSLLFIGMLLSASVFAQSTSHFYSKQEILNRLANMGLCSSRAKQVFKLITTVSESDQPEATDNMYQVAFNPSAIKQELQSEGLDAEGANNMLHGYLRLLYRGFQDDSVEQRIIMPAPVAQSACTNPGFETGDFTGWSGTTGCDTLDPNGYYYCYPFTPGIVNGRQTIMSGTGTDPYGGFPVVNPNGGGNFSVRLGNSNVGGESEQLMYSFVPDSSDDIFTYWYAVVLEDPAGHSAIEQPWFQVNMNVGGQDIPWGDKFIAANNAPGFNSVPPDVVYKGWTPVSLDLSQYIGQIVNLTFTTSDCSLGGHFGYAYIDCACGSQGPVAVTDSCQRSILNDDFSTSSNWQVTGNGRVNVSNGACHFDSVSNRYDNRVYQNLGTTLSDTYWKAETDFTINNANAAGHGVKDVVMALTAGTQPFLHSDTTNSYAVTHQDGIGVVLESDNNTDNNINHWHFSIYDKKDSMPVAGSAAAKIYADSAISHYYVRLERVSKGEVQLSVFSDSTFTTSLPGSPVNLAIDSSIAGLNTIQHGVYISNDSISMLTATIDNDHVCDDGLSTSTKGVQDHSDQLLIYPNPANTSLNIWAGKMSQGNYVIYNMLGAMVEVGKVNVRTRVDISDLPEGMYMIEVSDGHHFYRKKFQKIK